jgi:hypothetical protein
MVARPALIGEVEFDRNVSGAGGILGLVVVEYTRFLDKAAQSARIRGTF